jgi:hypothetical protein
MPKNGRIVIDATGLVVAADPAFRTLMRTLEDQVGINALDITAPSDRDRCTILVGKVIADGQPCSTVKRMIRADGTHVWVHNTLTATDTADARLIEIEVAESCPPAGWVEPDKLLDVARLVFESRRGRDASFGSALFADPAWDLLLAAYICEAEGSVSTIARVHGRTAMPLVGASRWMRALRAEGLLEYEDGGNTALVTTPFRLTSAAHQKFEAYLSELYLISDTADRVSLN